MLCPLPLQELTLALFVLPSAALPSVSSSLERFLAPPRAQTAQQIGTPPPAAPVQPPAPQVQEPQTQPGETVVTAERESVEPTPIDRIGSRDVLTPADLARVPPVDLNEFVQRVPGVSTRPYNGGDFIAPNWAIRGLPDDGLTEYILTTIDGVPANPMPYGWTAMSYFPLLPDQIAGIELIKGGFAVRHSPNTVGGVLNFITPPIPHEPTFTAKGTYGSYDFQSETFGYGDTVGDFGYLVTGGVLSGDGYRERGEFEAQSVDAKLRWSLGADRWLSTRIGYFNQRHQRPGGLTLAQYEEDRFQNTRPTNHQFGDRVGGDFTLHQDEGDGFTEIYGWLFSTSNTIDGPKTYSDSETLRRRNSYTQWNANLGARQERRFDWLGLEHALHYGARASYEWLPQRKFEDSPLSGGPSTVTLDTSYYDTALSAHVDDTVEPVQGLKATLGLRAEYVPSAHGYNRVGGGEFDDEFFDVLPAAGVSYAPSESVAVFASYQESFRAPQVWGFGTAATAADDDQGLDFEHGKGMELGVRGRPGAGVEASATVWRTDFDDVGISVDSVYQTIGNVVAEGLDLAASWEAGEALESLRGWRVGSSVTFQDSVLEDAASPANDGHDTPFAWDRKLAWYLEHGLREGWVVGIDGYYIGESFADEANTVAESADGRVGLNPARTIWGASLRKQFDLRDGARMSLALRVTNLFDEEWYLHTRIGGKLAGAPQMVFLSLDLSF